MANFLSGLFGFLVVPVVLGVVFAMLWFFVQMPMLNHHYVRFGLVLFLGVFLIWMGWLYFIADRQ